MELRNNRRRREYRRLKNILSSMGIYDDGMDLQEMREVLNALHTSAHENETSFSELEMQQALEESQTDFVPTEDDNFIPPQEAPFIPPLDAPALNSTMMSFSLRSNTSASSSTGSPDSQPNTIEVQAIVHHAMDWSPPNETTPRKRLPSIVIEEDSGSSSHEIKYRRLEPKAKRYNSLRASNETLDTSDSAKSFSDGKSSTSREHLDSFATSNSSLSRELEPDSLRRFEDSGLIESNMLQSSTNITSGNLTGTSADNLSTQQNLGDEACENSHEIHGPISVRRIHDSGLNLSTESPTSSAAQDDNLIGSFETSIQDRPVENLDEIQPNSEHIV